MGFRFGAVVALLILLLPQVAHAEPILQLYVEGATYNEATESWDLPGDTFTLWVIGNTGAKDSGVIEDVKLAFAYNTGEVLGGTITPTTTGGYGGFVDPSTAALPVFSQTVTDGSTPLLGDGSPLPDHGIYGPGATWTEFLLGDFSLQDSQIADFMTALPTPGKANSAQINVYDITVTGVTDLHIDVYNHIDGKNHVRYTFAPFSHDAGSDPTPEPGTLVLFAGALAGYVCWRRRSR